MIPINTSLDVFLATGTAVSSYTTHTIAVNAPFKCFWPITLMTPNSTISGIAKIESFITGDTFAPVASETIGTVQHMFRLAIDSPVTKIIELTPGYYFVSVCSGGWQGTTNLTGTVIFGTGYVITAHT